MESILRGLEAALYASNQVDIYLNYLCKVQHLQPAAKLEESLADYWSIILKFLIHATNIFQLSTTRRALTSLSSQDINDFELRCHKLEGRVETNADNCDREGTREFYAIMCEQRKDLEFLRLNYAIVDQIWKVMRRDERTKILQWVSRIPYIDNHLTASEGRTEGTSVWIFDRTEYKTWARSCRSMILWLHGIRKLLLKVGRGLFLI